MREQLRDIIGKILAQYPCSTIRDVSDITSIIAIKIEKAGYRKPLKKTDGCITLSENCDIEIEIPKYKDHEVVPKNIVLLGGLGIKLGDPEFVKDILAFIDEEHFKSIGNEEEGDAIKH